MRKNIFKNLILIFFTLLVFACLFIKSNECIQGIKEGLTLCASAVIPSLFPFMIASQFIIKSGLADFLSIAFGKVTNSIFKLSGICSTVIIMSLIGGFPVGAKMTCDLLESGKISKNEAQRLNLFCINAGPAFVIGTVGEIFYNNKNVGILLFSSTVFASIITGIFSTILYEKPQNKRTIKVQEDVTNPITAFSYSMADSSKAMLSVCSWVIIFNAIIKCLISIGDFEYLTIVCSLLEVTTGIKMSCASMPLPVISAILSFGGISVHCQIFSYIQKSGLKLKLFYTARVICACISGIICNLLLQIFPFEEEVFSNISSVTPSAYSVSLPSAVAVIIMCSVLIFEVDTDRKVC